MQSHADVKYYCGYCLAPRTAIYLDTADGYRWREVPECDPATTECRDCRAIALSQYGKRIRLFPALYTPTDQEWLLVTSRGRVSLTLDEEGEVMGWANRYAPEATDVVILIGENFLDMLTLLDPQCREVFPVDAAGD